MIFSTSSEQPLHACLPPNHLSLSSQSSFAGSSTSLLSDPFLEEMTLIGSSSIDSLSVSPGVRVSITDFIGNTTQTAYHLGYLNQATFTYADSVNSNDINDFYQFHLDNTAPINLGLTGMSANANLYLLNSAGETIAASTRSGTQNEAISRSLNPGVYYLQVQSEAGASTTYQVNLAAGGIASDPGRNFANARDLGNLSRKSWNISDFVGASDANDYYRFDLSENGNFHLNLNSSSSNLVIGLYDRTGKFLTASTRAGILTETINQALDAGTYYIRIYPVISDNNYTLRVSTDTPSHSGTRTLTGTLGADTFDVIGNYTRTVISGNGNVDFGTGRRDWLDLSSLLSTDVSINLTNTTGGGVFYDPGNGTRVFDSILLKDGRQILLEGIDQIRFSDRTINLSVVPNDPLFSQQWNLSMMNVQNAWRFTTGSSQVMVGVQDSGLGLDVNGQIPPDLHWIWYNTGNKFGDDFFNQYRNTTESFSHGTAVQSIIASNSNNGIGMSGINWNSEFYVADVLGSNAGDFSLAQSTKIMAEFAVSRNQRLVINMSLGWEGSFNQTGIDPALEATIAANPNVLFVIAAGNNGDLGISGLAYPASLARTYSNVMAVGASWGRMDYFGNSRTLGTRVEYPGWWGSQYGNGLTLMGPSEVLAQSAIRSLSGQVSFDYEPRFNGTSAATPNVAGVSSLVWSANPALTAVQVRQILSQTATDLGAPGYDPHYGNGFINADAAVRRAIALSAGYA